MLQLGQQDAVGHHLDAALLRRTVGEPDLVADGLPQLAAELLGDPLRDAARGDPAGLGVTRPCRRPRCPAGHAPGRGRSSAAAWSSRTRSRRPRSRPGGPGSPGRCRHDARIPAGREGSGCAQPGHSPRRARADQAGPDLSAWASASPGWASVPGRGAASFRGPGCPVRCPARCPGRSATAACPGGGICPPRWNRCPGPPRVSWSSPALGERGTTQAADDHRRQGDGDHGPQRPEPVDEPLLGRRCGAGPLLQGRVRRQHALAGIGLERLGGRVARRVGLVVHGSMVRAEPVPVLWLRVEARFTGNTQRTHGPLRRSDATEW